jgi:hypothetical protein
MRIARMSHRSLLASLIAIAIAVPGACGGKTGSPAAQGDDASPPDGPGSSTSSSSSSGSGSPASNCTNGDGNAVIGTVCEPQLYYTAECNGIVCDWTVELPCSPDGGGPVGDAGPSCESLCLAGAPFDAGSFSCSLVPTTDGRGVMATCANNTDAICIDGG